MCFSGRRGFFLSASIPMSHLLNHFDVQSRRKGRDLQKVEFYDPINSQTYLNVLLNFYFLEKGCQLVEIVHDISKKVGFSSP